jgi:hypothetical protein
MSRKRREETSTSAFSFTQPGDPLSGDAETERSGKGVWYAEKPDRDLQCGFRASIAYQTLLPGEAVVRSFSQPDRLRLNQCSRFSEFDIDTLMAKKLHHRSPMKTPLPISPENGM